MMPFGKWGRLTLCLYRGSLFAYPAAFREEYSRELFLAFTDRCREARSILDLFSIWQHATWGVFLEAPKEHAHMILQDLRYAIRVLGKDAGTMAAALAILALGIGSTTLVFSIANGLLLRPLPYPDEQRLVRVDEYSPSDPNERDTVSFPNYYDFRERTKLLEQIGVYLSGQISLIGPNGAQRVPASSLSDGALLATGVAPLFGRSFTREDCFPNSARVALIGEDLWRTTYGADPGILGKPLATVDTRYTIIGVMPSGFHFPDRAAVWFPNRSDVTKVPRTDYHMRAVARLRPGVTVAQATAELRAMLDQIHREHPEANNNWSVRATPFRDVETATYRPTVFTLLIAVSFLLLIACANISNLLLAKASARGREMAVRTAIGATRPRLIRQLISESAVLGIAGGALGVLLAYAGVPALLRLIPVELPQWMNFAVDGRVLLFALGVSLLTSVAFGIAPAIGASSTDLTIALKEGSRGSSGLRQAMLRHGLVVAEVAVSAMLLIGAGLMIRSFLNLRGQSLGYRAENVLSLSLNYSDRKYPNGPKARDLLDRVSRELTSLPGASSVGFTSEAPLDSGWTRLYTIEGRELPLKEMSFVNHLVVSPAYFRTLEIPLLLGRDFTDADFDTPTVMIVSQEFARQHWPGENAIGKHVRFGPPKNNEPWMTVVGVVPASRQMRLKGVDGASVYLPYSANFTPSSVLLRTSGDPLQLTQGIRARIAAIDPEIAVSHVLTIEQLIDRAGWQERLFGVLMGAFAAFALALCAIGLYAVLSYAVSQRKHEIGIRMALGASAGSVRLMIMRHGLALAVAGLAIGAGAAIGLTQLLRNQLVNLSPHDPAIYIIALATLFSIAVLAAFIPALRATRVDPLIALRSE